MYKEILVVGPDPSLIGGVSNYIRLLMRYSQIFVQYSMHLNFLIQGKHKVKSHYIHTTLLYLLQIIKYSFILKNRIRVVHLNPSIELVSMIRDGIYLRIAKTRNIPVLFFIHGWDDKYFENSVKKRAFSKFHHKTLKLADRIVVLSPEFKKELENIGINGDKIDVLSTMVETDKYLPEKKDFSPPYKLLFCSRLEREKGIYETLEAMKIIKEKYPDVKLYLMGTGSEMENVKKYIKEEKLEKNVILLGYKIGEEKYKIYKETHIFIFPSYKEGFPTVILEAMAAGLAIITTPVGGVKYAFKDGENGFFLSTIPPDPEEIAKKVIYLIENSEVLLNISKNNIEKAKEKYDVTVILDKLREIYEGLI